MKVKKFDTQNGLYEFELDGDFCTAFHSHPVIEILWSHGGLFNLCTPCEKFEAVNFAIIKPNQKHSVEAVDCQLNFCMVEYRNATLEEYFSAKHISFNTGVYCSSNLSPALLDDLLDNLPQEKDYLDDRVQLILEYLENSLPEFVGMMPTLSRIVFLSESRMSHLFKSEIGISLKKFLVWSRLKRTIEHLLIHEFGFIESLHNSGFYDQAHFTKAFKMMLGVKPSWAYNSRTVQV
jgi:AraC-like DNA-binding protein